MRPHSSSELAEISSRLASRFEALGASSDGSQLTSQDFRDIALLLSALTDQLQTEIGM